MTEVTQANPVTVGVTGAYGQFGWHLRCHFFGNQRVKTRCAGRDTFADPEALKEFVNYADVIVHLAGVNRAEPEEVGRANPQIARDLVGALDTTGRKPHLIYASSTHANSGTVYGNSKRAAGEMLAAWAERTEAKYTEFVFPHLFGEYGRPDYNSAVSTFCYQLANDIELNVNGDAEVELLHFQDASRLVLDALINRETGSIRPKGHAITVRDLAARLTGLANSYRDMIVPDLRDPFDLRLFNVIRGFFYPEFYPAALKTHTDDRGALTEMVKSLNGGQTFFSSTNPGVTRGNHFHYNKVERFLVVRGSARISIRKLLTDEICDFDVSGDDMQFIDMPTLHTHNITNTGNDELVTLFWSHEIFDPDNPDTVFEPVTSL